MNCTVDGILRRAFEKGGRRRCPQLPQPLMWKWPEGTRAAQLQLQLGHTREVEMMIEARGGQCPRTPHV